MSRMQTFGTVCYSHRQDRKKIDSRSDKGTFIGYDKNSPAYMVYYPDSRKVIKQRLVRFVSNVEGQQTDINSDTSEDEMGVQYSTISPDPNELKQCDIPEARPGPSQIGFQTSEVKPEPQSPWRYPARERMRPDFYGVERDQTQINIDYCYKTGTPDFHRSCDFI